MRVLRDFRCDSGHVSEEFIDSEITSIKCQCGLHANRMLGYGTIMLDGTDRSFPSAWDKWATTREKRHQKLAEKNRKEGKV